MIKIHKSELRGKGKAGWLDTSHSFSFGSFYDPTRMGFKSLRVINEDYVIGGAGFPTHGHDNMEIITYVIEGALEHKDSTGTGAVIRPGDIQKMSAGTGIEHSEFNHSKTETVHLLQIWIIPNKRDISPKYEQKTFDPKSYINNFKLVGDTKGTDGGISIQQDVKMFIAKVEQGKAVSYSFEKGRAGFLQIVKGSLDVGGQHLKQGDGAEITGLDSFSVEAASDAELILFDLKD